MSACGQCACCAELGEQYARVDYALRAEIERLRIQPLRTEPYPTDLDKRRLMRLETLRDVQRLMLDPKLAGVPGA